MVKERIFVGLSSGWAADGIDAAAVAISGRGQRMKVRVLHHLHRPFAPALHDRILAASRPKHQSADAFARLDGEIAREFASAGADLISESKIDPDQIVAVGTSGQTLARSSGSEEKELTRGVLELGNPAIIARSIGRPTVGGFAGSDLAVGGGGGPLTAFPDYALFRDKRLSRVVLHLGGTASLTFVPGDPDPCDVVAFDAGPCALVLDALGRKHFAQSCDRDGAIAGRGKVFGSLIHELKEHKHFRTRPPKLTSAGEWGEGYIERLDIIAAKHNCEGADLIATCTEWIARCIVDAINSLTERPHEIVLTGGAARNIHLSGRIRAMMSPSSTYPCEHYAFDAQSYSATCYAMLAAARVDKKPAHCPAATGASCAAVLGAVWLP